MAISSDKLLNRPSELHRRYGGRLAMQKAQQEKMVGGGPVSIIFTKKSIKNIELIKDNVVKIEGILKGTIAAEKKALDEKKKKESSQRREKQEEKLETKPDMSMGSIKMPRLPRMGILDWIKNFIGKIILGYFAYRLIEHLPKIIPIVKFIGNATDFIIDVGGKLLNGLAIFIDRGYKAYDATRGFIKNIGGENFAQGFDKFVGAIDTALFLTTVLATDLAAEAMFGRRDGGGGDPTGGKPRPGQGGRPKVTTSGGGGAGRPDIRNPLRQKPTVTTGKGGKPGGFRLPGTGPRVTGSGGGPKIKPPKGIKARGGLLGLVFLIPDLIDAGMLVSQGRGKDGLRTLLSAVSGVVAGMAAYSATLAGAAALGITGVGLPAAIGLAVAGLAASNAAGYAAYNLADAGLKKMGLIDKDPKTGTPYAYRRGGITRGGKSQGGVKRTIKKGKYKRVLAPKKPSETKFETKDKNVKEVSKDLDKTKYFGPVLSVSAKILENQKPTQKDYENVGLGLNLLISKGIEEKQLKGGLVAAFAEGGMVDDDFLEASEKGGDISNWVTETFKNLFETKVEKNLRMIKESIEKRKQKAPDAKDMGETDEGGGVQVSSDSEDFWLLATAAMFENSNPQGAADVAQVIYNRTQYPAWNAPTIKKAILNPGQFQPVRQYGGTSAWASIKTKEDALRFSKSYGKTQEQLERVAAALLDKSKQQSARQFVGARDSFRADAYEAANNHLADETEVKRHGHTFGFEPGGAMIGQFKAGKLSAAQVNAGIKGDVSYDDTKLGPGSKEWRFGRTGRLSVAPGFSHAHFDGKDEASLTRDMIPLLKKMASSGLKPELKDGTPILSGKDNKYYQEIVKSGMAQHTHRPGPRMDVNMPGFPLVPFPLKYSFYQEGGAGHSAVVPGSGKTLLFHMSKKPDGSAFHGENFGVVPRDGFMLRLHKGEVFKVIDRDSVDLLGFDLTKEIIDIENRSQLIAKAPSIIEKLKAISGYTDYEQPYAEPEIIEVPVPMPFSDGGDYSSGGFSMAMGGGGEEDSSFDSLYVGG